MINVEHITILEKFEINILRDICEKNRTFEVISISGQNMALTVDKLINDDRFTGDNILTFLLYLPLGIILLCVRLVLILVLWIASIVLPNKWAARQVLTTVACWAFGIYVKLRGARDPHCSVLVANYVSCLDSLAVRHVLGTTTLRKWKVPPFFASILGVKNSAQFVRKLHFAESPNKPILLQPEGGPTNGKGLLMFTDWPFQLGTRVQPIAITAERPFTALTVHSPSDSRSSFPWSDMLWFLLSPTTRITVRALPPVRRALEDDYDYSDKIRAAIADALKVEVTEYRWEQLSRQPARAPRPDLTRLARQVKEVLPRVPLADILRDLASTRSVDVTITNFLEGATRYTPEPEPEEPRPTTSHQTSAPRYVTPTPTGVFSKTAKDRQLSFQERKAQMIAEARKRYIEKHNLDIAC